MKHLDVMLRNLGTDSDQKIISLTVMYYLQIHLKTICEMGIINIWRRQIGNTSKDIVKMKECTPSKEMT